MATPPPTVFRRNLTFIPGGSAMSPSVRVYNPSRVCASPSGGISGVQPGRRSMSVYVTSALYFCLCL